MKFKYITEIEALNQTITTFERFAECPLCEYYKMDCDHCVLKSCNGQLYKWYHIHDLHKFVFGCAEIINRCYNRLEELEERA